MLKLFHFLEIYIGNGDWRCCYIRGSCSYVCRSKQGRNHVPYRELVGTTERKTL
jgi:hypothetical protein